MARGLSLYVYILCAHLVGETAAQTSFLVTQSRFLHRTRPTGESLNMEVDFFGKGHRQDERTEGFDPGATDPLLAESH